MEQMDIYLPNQPASCSHNCLRMIFVSRDGFNEFDDCGNKSPRMINFSYTIKQVYTTLQGVLRVMKEKYGKKWCF